MKQQKNILIIFAYYLFICLLIYITPPYGDPGNVLFTSKVMLRTGFPYDPVCSGKISELEMVLCTRSPLYYSLLALAGDFYKIIPMILTGLYFIFQIILARLNGSSLSVFALMYPPIYLLYSRTYVDTLTATLSTLILIALIKTNTKNTKQYGILLFLLPMLLVLTRESALALPLLLLIIFFIKPEFRNKKMLTPLFGWIIGVIIWQLYVSMSEGKAYSVPRPHLPTLEELYKAIITILTPILPWEVRPDDLQAYLVPANFATPMANLVGIVVILFGFIGLIPLLMSLINYKLVDRLILGQVIFGITIAGGLLSLLGNVDFFRHLAYFLPVAPLLIELGINVIQKRTRIGVIMIKMSFVIMLTLYFVRTVRLFSSGYQSDPCHDYILKRQDLLTVRYFYETACG
jgi:hypothetical protein